MIVRDRDRSPWTSPPPNRCSGRASPERAVSFMSRSAAGGSGAAYGYRRVAALVSRWLVG